MSGSDRGAGKPVTPMEEKRLLRLGAVILFLLLFLCVRSSAGPRQDGAPGSLPSCCGWEGIQALLASSGSDGSRTMAETLYVLSTQDALRAVGDALRTQKSCVGQAMPSRKRKQLMETEKSLQGARADLQTEMEALTKDNVRNKGELLKDMKNALDAIQLDLSIHERIREGKTAAPALLKDVEDLDRLLARISADCRAYLSGGG